ncbi:MAG: hypothetical protein LPJ89_02615 [Hymenobacteraceae bacterium]|nr:hypothetical protein [Hymenobacteraceae bacterium]MDX5397975.1 hypothetical protein [Hymenobacteraceae bacterium]MDX5442658.1 hypothetical protein [Hymenobacteraceae bacterium]MDX5514047.1 hypothetical protein [Hymenobacteraceae bacterium]
MSQNKEENKNNQNAGNFSSNPAKSFEAGKQGTQGSSEIINKSSGKETGPANSDNSTSVGSSSRVQQPQHQRGPGSEMYPSSQNLSESGKKEGQLRSGDATKAKKSSEEGKGWAIDGRDHIET